ncbi:MAG: DUF58 domain-containing protein [Alphaproteobacteria bacterium]|nr:DUF58 domain-containing protein [Alphaproteobacteria bacterium]
MTLYQSYLNLSRYRKDSTMPWFSKNSENMHNRFDGLAVSVEDLIAQQRYLPYLSLQPNKLTSNRAGDVKSAFKGRGMEFEEVRAYNFSDDIRDIDWRVTARKSEPYTKIFNEEKDREIVVFLDLSATMVFGTRNELKSVTASKLASLIGWITVRNKDRFGLLIYDGKQTTYFKPQNNFTNLMYMFNQIALKSREILQYGALGDMSEAFDVLQYSQKGKGTVFILSDFYHIDTEKFKKIAVLARKHQVYCVNIFDVLEEVAPQEGTYAAQYNDSKLVFDTSSEDFRNQYQRYFKNNRENIKKNCQKFLCRYLEIRTDIPIFKQLSQI